MPFTSATSLVDLNRFESYMSLVNYCSKKECRQEMVPSLSMKNKPFLNITSLNFKDNGNDNINFNDIINKNTPKTSSSFASSRLCEIKKVSIINSKKMNTILLKEMISNNYVKVNKHPEHDLFIYNYTAKAQYDRIWNEITLMCRGLILDANDTIIARPFPKFFNFGESENQELPSLPFEVYDKMDGSLGILYWINKIPFIASRGSFNSDQAEKATQMMHKKYRDSWVNLDASKTYLLEIIYPENRIVVDYGVEEKLVLLAVIDTKSGAEFPLENIGFPIVEKFDGIDDFEVLKAKNKDNKEGYVIKFANDFRIKIKFEEYLRLHRIVTQVSTINIWEYLKENQSADELLERVPDEFFNWVKKTKNDLEQKFASIENQCKQDFKILESEKETALYFQKCAYPSVLFFMLKNRDYRPIIWKYIRPEFEKPFNIREEL